jgi:hypothetical protein
VIQEVEEMAEIVKFSIWKRATLHTDLDKDLPSRRAAHRSGKS